MTLRTRVGPGLIAKFGMMVAAIQCAGATSTSSGNDASVDVGGSSGGGPGSSSSSSSSGGGSGGGGSSGNSSSGGGSSSSSGSSSGSSSSSSSGASACSPACSAGFTCCSGNCVNTSNDPKNCGVCGAKCTGATPFCQGSCKQAPCYQDAASCGASSCCGTQCCGITETCCLIELGASSIQCVAADAGQPTCPAGCPLCRSDRNLKRDIIAVDTQKVLDAVARMPVSTWSYKSDDPSVRHMGPMAQDFKAAFGLGDTDKAYNSVDAHGVTLAAIQALYERVQAQDERIERLERENRELRAPPLEGPARASPPISIAP
jgi:hypothetical protein